jgi:rhodanese-related sulfurtransferase
MFQRWISSLSLAGVLTVVAVAQSTAQTVVPVPSVFSTTLMESDQKTAEVSTDELRRILDDHSAIVFDARPPMEYATSHIPGARNVGQKPGTPTSLYVSDVAEVERLVPDRTAALVLYCNGPFCGKSKRLSEDLLQAGYANVRRYQLGAPTWRALVGVMQIELDGVQYVMARDGTAVFLDARDVDAFAGGSIPGALRLPVDEVTQAKDDGRLPMDDHNTRIVVFGANERQARALAEALAKNAFHNVTYYAGSVDTVVAAIGADGL